MPRSRRGQARTAGRRPAAAPGLDGRVDDVRGHRALVPVVEEPDRRPHPRIRVVPPRPPRIRQRRHDRHVGQFGHQQGEHLRVAHGNVRRVPRQHVAARPKLLGVHGQRTDADRRRERPGTRKPALGQPGLRRDTRPGPTVVGARLDHDVRAIGQPETEHHRDRLTLEQHVGGFATELVPTPGRQPGRQIVQRHSLRLRSAGSGRSSVGPAMARRPGGGPPRTSAPPAPRGSRRRRRR